MQSLRRLVPGAAALASLACLFGIASASASNPAPHEASGTYQFARLPIAMPPGYEATEKRTVREVNPNYAKIRSWISSVGASIAINDVAGNGRESGMCLVDTRTDSVVVTYTPTAPEADRFTPFTLDSGDLPSSDAIAPMGCAPGDFNEDGHNDFLVYYWGRTPILFLGQGLTPSPQAYRPAELVPSAPSESGYVGDPWNTNAVAVNDFSGDGHPDIVIGNYFPQSGVLDPKGRNDVHMNDSLSRATNGGGLRVLRWVRNDATGQPVYVEDKDAVPYDYATGWALALGSGDLTGDQLPEMYVANDFGHDHLLHNVSTSQRIAFTPAIGERGPTTPKSFVLGQGSFKGMGVDFVDLDNRGRFDMVVSNITTAWGLEESNFVWRNDAESEADMTSALRQGHAPFTQVAQERGLAWTGWAWDIKAADFLNSGFVDIVQTDGFVKGEEGRNRWAWLQELATANDVLVREPNLWPKVEPGDDLSGRQKLAFYARTAEGRFANIGEHIGIDIETPSRGIAIADTTGAGTLDFAVAYQWEAPVFFRNTSPQLGKSIELRLVRPAAHGHSPAYGASVTLTTSDGRTQLSQLDGGSGHAGKRGFAVHFGTGQEAGDAKATIRWRDHRGQHSQTLDVAPGIHTIELTDQAKEK